MNATSSLFVEDKFYSLLYFALSENECKAFKLSSKKQWYRTFTNVVSYNILSVIVLNSLWRSRNSCNDI
jgi:hypothetical protein